jgi:hypothetical protein
MLNIKEIEREIEALNIIQIIGRFGAQFPLNPHIYTSSYTHINHYLFTHSHPFSIHPPFFFYKNLRDLVLKIGSVLGTQTLAAVNNYINFRCPTSQLSPLLLIARQDLQHLTGDPYIDKLCETINIIKHNLPRPINLMSRVLLASINLGPWRFSERTYYTIYKVGVRPNISRQHLIIPRISIQTSKRLLGDRIVKLKRLRAIRLRKETAVEAQNWEWVENEKDDKVIDPKTSPSEIDNLTTGAFDLAGIKSTGDNFSWVFSRAGNTGVRDRIYIGDISP